MTGLTSLVTIALAIVFCLTISTADAGSKHSRSNCETRLFQKDETEACFTSNGESYVFVKTAAPALLPGGSTSGFRLLNSTGAFYDCGCQLWRKNDLICARGAGALIGSIDRRGKRIWGETLEGGEQAKITLKREGDVQVCD